MSFCVEVLENIKICLHCSFGGASKVVFHNLNSLARFARQVYNIIDGDVKFLRQPTIIISAFNPQVSKKFCRLAPHICRHCVQYVCRERCAKDLFPHERHCAREMTWHINHFAVYICHVNPGLEQSVDVCYDRVDEEVTRAEYAKRGLTESLES